MTASFTDQPEWIEKMKMRFAMLDLNNDGLHSNADVAIAAKRIAAYQNQGEEAEKRYFIILQAVTLAEDRGVTEEEFVQKLKNFVSQPHAKEHVKELADTVFDVIDANKNGVISYDEYVQFHSILNASQKIIDTFFKAADTNKDGIIDRSEIQASYAKYFFSA